MWQPAHLMACTLTAASGMNRSQSEPPRLAQLSISNPVNTERWNLLFKSIHHVCVALDNHVCVATDNHVCVAIDIHILEPESQLLVSEDEKWVAHNGGLWW